MGASYFYFQKAPLGWRDAPAVVALAAQIRKRDPRLLLLDLWDWAKIHGDSHPLETATEAIERGAGWRGKRGALYQGLVAAGWVRESDGQAVILDWDADGIVKGRPTTTGVVPLGGDILDVVEKQRVAARIRKQKSRDKKNNVTPESVTRHNDGVTSIPLGSSNRPESTIYEGIVTPKSKREEEDKDKDKNLALFAPAHGAESGEDKPKRGRPPKDTPEIVTDREAWLAKARALIGLTPEETPPSTGFYALFAKTRKQRGMEQLMRALDGLMGDPWASKQGLATLLSATLIEKGLAKWNAQSGTLKVSRIEHKAGWLDASELYSEDAK